MRFSHGRHGLRLTGAATLLGLAALVTSPPARADAAWPTRPITFVVPGAGGTLGSSLVARAQPDGCTVLVGNTGSNAINYSAYQKLPYKAEDFVALTDMIPFANVLVVPAKSPVKSLNDLVAAARREPGKLAFASAGVGQTTHLMGELLRQSAGVEVVHVPYKGFAPATMAVTGSACEPDLPDVPTMTELGMKDLNKVGWMGFFLPAKTPPTIVKKLTDNLIAVLQDPAVVQRYRELGGRPGGMPSDQFAQMVARDRQGWGELIRSQKLQLD